MSGSESHRKPSSEPDFSSLADYVAEPSTPPWQFGAQSEKPESNAELNYVVDENLKSERDAALQETVDRNWFLGGIFSAIGALGIFFFVTGPSPGDGGLILFLLTMVLFTGFYFLFKAYFQLNHFMLMFGPYRGVAKKARISTEWMMCELKSMVTKEPYGIRRESANDADAIHALHVQAFGQELEATLVDELRAEGFTKLSLVAVAGTRVIGHVLFSPIEIVSPERTVRALALAPVGVVPEWQRQGVAAALIREGLALAASEGEKIVIVLGDPNYYRRFGFRPELTAALQSPYAGEYFMALELSPGALNGVIGEVRYAAPFARLG